MYIQCFLSSYDLPEMLSREGYVILDSQIAVSLWGPWYWGEYKTEQDVAAVHPWGKGEGSRDM